MSEALDVRYKFLNTEKIKLTVTTHSSCDAFLESTVLTSVPVDPKDVTLLVFGAGPILDLLLNRPSKETLQNNKENINKIRPNAL